MPATAKKNLALQAVLAVAPVVVRAAHLARAPLIVQTKKTMAEPTQPHRNKPKDVQVHFQYPTLTPAQKNQMLTYAEQTLRAAEHMLNPQKKHHLLHYTLLHHQHHRPQQHYPKGDRIDANTGAQYFYHCHGEARANEEHGHFHCFIRYAHIPKHIKPHPLPDWDKYIDNPMTHLVAIAINRYGKPIRLFTVNRWVSSEIWYDAIHTEQLLAQFKFTHNAHPHWSMLDQWIEGMLHLFAPQIIFLAKARDQMIKNRYTDQTLSELSTLPIDLEQQIQWLLA